VWTLLVGLLIGACGNSGSACPSGTTRACLSDGTTCVCAPNCSSLEGCIKYSVIVGGQPPLPCTSACTCAASLCLPNTWNPGDSVIFSADQ
jgi:hypothetical protein